jgi:phage/plasmid-associated DNA primase
MAESWSGASPDEIREEARRQFGEPNEKLGDGARIRFGGKGSVMVDLAGEAAGCWYDHERRKGGVLERPRVGADGRHGHRGKPAAPAAGGAAAAGADRAAPPAADDPSRGTGGHDHAAGEDEEAQRGLAFLRGQFDAAAPLSGSDPAGRYLTGRRLEGPASEADLRYSAEARLTPEGRPGPALIAAVRDAAGGMVAHHLVLLSERGEALRAPDGRRLKLSFGAVSAGFVHLGPACAKVMAVAEGVETAMSRLAAGPAMVRACVGALHYCEPPRGTERVEVVADRDKVHEARRLAQRYARAGFAAFVVEPPDDLLARDGPVVFDEDRVWRYHGHRWEPVTDGSLTRLVQRWDGAAYPDGRQERRVRLGRSRINSAIANLVALRDQQGWSHAAPRGLACDGGFIRLADDGTPAVEPHRREHRVRHLIPGRWPADDYAERLQGSLLQKLLIGCFEGDPDAREKLLLVGEAAGSAAFGLATRIKAPMALILVGETAENGKSQVLAMLEGLVPPGAVCSISPAKMADERYLPVLAGKLLNIAGELSTAAIASDAFKEVVTGDLVSGREAYARATSFRPVAQHVFATNVLPGFRGGVDAGVLRRLRVLEFRRRIPAAERVVDIGRRVAEEERDLLLEFAVRGAGRLLRQQGFTEPPSSALALRRWITSVDPVRGWLETEVVVLPSDRTARWPAAAAYAHFEAWATGAGHQRAALPPLNGFVMRVRNANAEVAHRHAAKGGEFLNLAPAP